MSKGESQDFLWEPKALLIDYCSKSSIGPEGFGRKDFF